MLRWLISTLALWGAACAGAPPPTYLERTYPTGNLERARELRAQLTPAEVRMRMGEAAIPNPTDPSRPFGNPHLEFAFADPNERRIRVWLYLSELRTHSECPFLTWSDFPLVFEESALALWTWSDLEAKLEEYGKSHDWYRRLRHPRFGSCRRR